MKAQIPSSKGKHPGWGAHRPGPRRSLLLAAIGALLGLAIAGFGLFTADGTRTASIPPEDAAVVNNVPILRADFIQQLASLYNLTLPEATAAQKKRVLEDMIREELYVQRGVEMGLPTDDIDVRAALVQGTEALVAQDVMTTRPSEEDLRSWYSSHAQKYATEGIMTLHDWKAPAQASESLSGGLSAGATPQSLHLATSGKVDDGAEFYFAARLHLGDRLFAKARTMRDGEVSQSIETADGPHILQMIHNQVPVPTPYETVQPQVLQDFLAAKTQRLQAGNERFLHDRADIRAAADLK